MKKKRENTIRAARLGVLLLILRIFGFSLQKGAPGRQVAGNVHIMHANSISRSRFLTNSGPCNVFKVFVQRPKFF